MKLTEWTTCGGCAAKWGASPLAELLSSVAGVGASADLLVGLAPFDDAAVMRIDETTALVSTTDFFPPLVDDPEDFGAIAAANACSDVFAMGARVTLALNIAAFPEDFPPAAIAAIFGAASEVVSAAGGVVAGGHTIRSAEPIFGLAVQGLVDPQAVWTKAGARPGDAIVLSKPIGTGLALAGGGDVAPVVAGMRTLNKASAEILLAGSEAPHAVTDVTGFGLLGHAWEMAERSGVEMRIDFARVPTHPAAVEAAQRGVRTGGDPRNRSHLASKVDVEAVDEVAQALAFDPQTSGGLLAAVAPTTVDQLEGFTVIGEVIAAPPSVRLV